MSFENRDNALSVGELTRYLKMLVDNDALLSSVSVRGEISNLKYHSSGHLYFTLKDGDAELSAVMFRSSAQNLRFTAKDGMQVIAFGRVSVYEKGGRCQLYVSAMLDNGIGALQLEYERLRKKLSEEGLFDESKKKKIPQFPSCIGIITSPTGAAVRDMINVTGRRWPSAKILLYPALVQGAQAPESLCAGLDYFNATSCCDVIIIGRGGGSIEDLWAFNDENVVRRVATSDIPTISAVGHETDFTLCDFVADLRAPTPSAAAELATPDRDEIRLRFDELSVRCENAFARCLAIKKERYLNLSKQLYLSSPEGKLVSQKNELEQKRLLLEQAIEKSLSKKRERLSVAAAELNAINPLAVLGRGYSCVQRNGNVVSSVKQISEGETVDIRFADGVAIATVNSINGENNYAE